MNEGFYTRSAGRLKGSQQSMLKVVALVPGWGGGHGVKSWAFCND